MKNLILLIAAISIVGSVSTEANAQRLFGRRVLGARSVSGQAYSSYSYSPSYSSARSARIPQPVTGYGSNLHRNFSIRKAQQRAALTGAPPRYSGNILWAR